MSENAGSQITVEKTELFNGAGTVTKIKAEFEEIDTKIMTENLEELKSFQSQFSKHMSESLNEFKREDIRGLIDDMEHYSLSLNRTDKFLFGADVFTIEQVKGGEGK